MNFDEKDFRILLWLLFPKKHPEFLNSNFNIFGRLKRSWDGLYCLQLRSCPRFNLGRNIDDIPDPPVMAPHGPTWPHMNFNRQRVGLGINAICPWPTASWFNNMYLLNFWGKIFQVKMRRDKSLKIGTQTFPFCNAPGLPSSQSWVMITQSNWLIL